LSILLSLLSHWLRAYRWNILLEPFQENLSTGRTFLAVMTGYLANLAFPRLGEVTRCAVLKKTDGISVSTSFGTVITERLIDFFILLSIICIDLIVEFDRIFNFVSDTIGFQKVIDNQFLTIGVLIILVISGLVGFFIIRSFLSKQTQNEFVLKVQKFLQKLMEGLFSLRKIKNIYGFAFSTIGIWVLYYLMSYVIVFAVDETSSLGFFAGLTILSAGGLAMAAPVQGGVGTYHTFVTAILLLYGIDGQTSLFFATLLHTSQIFSIALFGGLSVLITAFITKKRS
jgi:uncharacterized protein (TIRG00374 family)